MLRRHVLAGRTGITVLPTELPGAGLLKRYADRMGEQEVAAISGLA